MQSVEHVFFLEINKGFQQQDLRQYRQKFAKEPSHIRYSDFHLLVYLSKTLDIEVIWIL